MLLTYDRALQPVHSLELRSDVILQIVDTFVQGVDTAIKAGLQIVDSFVDIGLKVVSKTDLGRAATEHKLT